MNLVNVGDLARGQGEGRVLLVSRRGFNQWIPSSLLYEFENIICEVDAGDMIAPRRLPGPSSPLFAKALRSLHNATRIQFSRDSAIEDLTVDREYDLCFM